MEEIVKKLIELKKTIAFMESCTGGALTNEITNIPGSSNVLKFSAITYSNEYKMALGVDEKIINKYTVYSKETAEAMAKQISKFAKSTYGVGITGKLNKKDEFNLTGSDNDVFICIYDSQKDINYHEKIQVIKNTRKENKQEIIDTIIIKLKEILSE